MHGARKHSIRLEWVLSLAALAATFSVSAAFYVFFRGHRAGNPEDWARFGEYFGGMLNPLIGIITVFLVVLTLRMTREEARQTNEKLNLQIQMAKDQQIRDLMHKRLDGLLSEWNRMLDLPCPRIMDGEYSLYESGGTVRYYFELPGLAQNLKSAVNATSSKHTRMPLAGARNFFSPYLALLEEVSAYAEEYDQISGNKLLGDYFRRRIRGPARVLRELKMIDDHLWQTLHVSDLSGDDRQRTRRPLS